MSSATLVSYDVSSMPSAETSRITRPRRSKRRDRTAWGDAVVMVGEAPELGAWDPARGVRLDGATWPRWTGHVTVPAGARLRYKLVIVRADGRVDWEVGEDRELVVPTDPGLTGAEVDDVFRF